MKKNRQLAFLDVETTGLDPNWGDRVCEVGIVITGLENFEIVSEYSHLVDPRRPLSPGAFAINNITEEMLEDAPEFAEISDDVLRLLSDKIIVCHNAPFDLGFLAKEFLMLGKVVTFNKFIDTLLIARKYFNFHSNGLHNIARALNIGADGRHRALIDVHLTRKVLMYFMNELSKNNSARLMNFVNERIYESIYAERDRRVISNLPIIIEEAIKNRRKIHIKYISSEGKLSERVVEPKEVVFKCNALYLIGYCHLRGEERSFKLERFLRVELID